MPELTQEQIERLQNGEEVEVEIDVWHDPEAPRPMTETLILTGEDNAPERD